MKKATNLNEVDFALDFNSPVAPEHPFFVDFSTVRGDFQEKVVYKSLNVNLRDFSFDEKLNPLNKNLLFISGMRGSGKTSELRKYFTTLDKPNCFFCVFCNLDEELNLSNIEYMDILIFQLQKLIERAREKKLRLSSTVIQSLQSWFHETIKEANSKLKAEGSAEIQVKASTPGILSFFKIATALKAAVSSAEESSLTVRNILKNNFVNFSRKFNEFVEEVNREIRKKNLGREVLFIVDGLEKAMSIELRKKIIMEETNRLQQIRAYTMFTLPIELMKEQEYLKQFSTVISFPFVKLQKKDNAYIDAALEKFKEFVYKRIDETLFDKGETVIEAIKFCGGSPRELLRILKMANWLTDETKGIIDNESVKKAIQKLAEQSSKFITDAHIAKLKLIDENNKKSLITPFDDVIQDLIEKLIVFE